MASDDEIEIPEMDITIDPEKVNTEFLEVLQVIRPQWQKDNVVFEKLPKELTKGLLNTMVKCYESSDPVDTIMIRIHNDAIQFIDRSTESICIKHLQKTLACAPKILAVFKNGFCYQFIHGEVLTSDRLSEEPIWRMIAEEFAKIHSARIINDTTLTGEPQMEKMKEMIWAGFPDELEDPEKNKRFKSELPDKEFLKKEITFLHDHIMEYEPAAVLCHNDTRAENIVWNPEKGLLKFIDFEMTNYNYQANELAWHFKGFCGIPLPDYSKYPSEEFQMIWLRVYLSKYYKYTGRNPNDIKDKDIRRLYVLVCKYYLLTLIASGVMGLAMEKNNFLNTDAFDFLEFAIISVKEYFKKKEEILQLEMPPE